MSKTLRMYCLRCKATYGIPETDMSIIGYTKYTYCEDCLRKAIRLLTTKDEAEELREPFYVIDTPMGQKQTYKGKVMAFKKKTDAEYQLQETEMLMRKNGFGGWCGYMFVRPITLEGSGTKKTDYIWMDTISHMKKEGDNDKVN